MTWCCSGLFKPWSVTPNTRTKEEKKASTGEDDIRKNRISMDIWRSKEQKERRPLEIQHLGFYHKDRDVNEKYDLNTTRALGLGFSGKVVKATARDGSGDVAVKTLRRTKHFNEKEVEIFASVKHENVANLVEVFDTGTEVFLVMEILTGGELLKRLSNRGAYKEVDAAGACQQMCRALKYLHTRSFPIVHLDLKPDNWLYHTPDSDLLKLIDFGFSIEWDRQSNANSRATSAMAPYASPEVLNNQQCTEKSDIFSLGVIFYLILTGHPPFQNAKTQADFDKFKPWLQPAFRHLSEDAQSLLTRMLNFKATQRPSAEDIYNDRWLTTAGPVPMHPGVVVGIKTTCFQRACLKILAWSLSAKDAKELQKCFAERDSAKDGKLSLNEFRSVLRQSCSIPNADASHICANIQQEDNPGEICYKDFLEEVMRERLRLHQHVLESLWTSLADSTGTVLATSLQAIIPKSVSGVALVNGLDPKSTGKISLQSWKEFITSLLAPAAVPNKRVYTELVVSLIDDELGNAWIHSAP